MARHLHEVSKALVQAASVGGARIVLSVPPRHGKSELVSKYFPAWYLGVHPDRRIILSSYEADFAASWGRKARALLEEHGHLFGVKVAASSSAANRWDIEGRDGGMMTAGVGGPMTGKGAHVLIVDDPIKNYEEAHSETVRESIWNWFTSTAYTRLEPEGSVVLIQTRWHEDDLAGRVLRELTHEPWQEIKFPALALEGDPLGRTVGEALWPARFDAPRLEAIRKTLGSYQFSALYQQSPTPPEGEMFKRSWFEAVGASPAKAQRIRAWDKAGTEGAGDYSAGVLMAVDAEGIFTVEDVIRGRWSSHERNKVMRQTAEADREAHGTDYSVAIEQEPGSGGKESAEYTVKQLVGFAVIVDKPTGDKAVRARPFAAQAEAGNVKMRKAGWNREWLDELCSFPAGTHDDQVDASALGFNRLALYRKKRIMAW